jgi:hypothetical protein
MDREPIENEYFNWLCAKVTEPRSRNYIDLLRMLHSTPYAWFVPGDRNRAEDGCELRIDFLRMAHLESDPEWYDQPCSVLEMLIGFSKRAAFQTDISEKDWFWIFMTNLHLEDYRRVGNFDKPLIEDILTTFVWRTYHPSGQGGLFPMRTTTNDQRKVEVWYQFCEWLEDQGLI